MLVSERKYKIYAGSAQGNNNGDKTCRFSLVRAAKYTLNLEASVRHASVGVKQVYIYI